MSKADPSSTVVTARRHAPDRAAAVLAGAAAHDWMLFGHLLVLLALAVVGDGPTRTFAIGVLSLAAVWFGAVVTLVRATPTASAASSLLYRVSLVGVTLVAYLGLRWVLPVVAPRTLDAELLAFDLRIFGVEPAIAWDPYVTPARTEWFSFFYYSYFLVLAAFAIPIAVSFEDGRPLREFTFGLVFLFCVGHVTYVLVPALGPHAHVASFRHPLESPVFWPLVKETVDRAGAGRDVFPSLHTAAPIFLALYAFRHRAIRALRLACVPVSFAAVQIVLATMYLRWHYLVDVVAGAVLGVQALVVALTLTAWEARVRRTTALPPVFPPSPHLPTIDGARR